MGMGGSDGHRNDTLLIVIFMYGGYWAPKPVPGGGNRWTLGPRCMCTIIEPVSRSQAVGTVGPHLPIKLVPGICVLGVSLITIRSSVSPPSTSDNKPRIAYIWMYVSWDRYRDTYLDIWVRRVIIIIVTIMNIVMILDILGMFQSCSQFMALITISMIPVMIPVNWFMSFPVWFMSFLLSILVMIVVWFASLILYAWDCCGMRQGYIYEGFLVWIIPSTY